MSLEAFGGAWKFAASTDRQTAWSLIDTRRGATLLDIAWGKLNNSSESNAVSEKCRFHGKLDNAEVAVESQNIFPFGGESVIDRALTLRDRLLEVRVDVKPGRGEIIRNFELEELIFPGEYSKLEIVETLPEPGAAWQMKTLELAEGIIYSSKTPFALLLLTDADGMQLELGCGGDWWRMPGCGDTLWSIEKCGDAVKVKRRVVAIDADEVVERRPWRFNYYVAWGRSQAKAPENPQILAVDLQKEVKCECFRAPAVRKLLRKKIRQLDGGSNVVLQLPDISVCDDAGHLERPGKKVLRHWDLDELFALYSWANRAINGDKTLVITLPEDSFFRKLPSGRYLAGVPGEAMVREV